MGRLWFPQAVACAMLLWALNPEHPYAYYVLLRWVCCPIFAFLALRARRLGLEGWVWVLGVTAAIYNPIIPVHLTREIWSLVNLVTAGFVIGSITAFHRTSCRSEA